MGFECVCVHIIIKILIMIRHILSCLGNLKYSLARSYELYENSIKHFFPKHFKHVACRIDA